MTAPKAPTGFPQIFDQETGATLKINSDRSLNVLSGGATALSEADFDTRIGALADSAWVSGAGSVIALLKAIAAQALSTNPVQVFQSYSYVVMNSNATTTHKSGAGTLLGILVSAKGASSNVLDVYDNTAGSGTKIIDSLDTVNANIGFIPVMASFAIGLTAVMGTGTAAKLTFIYR